MYRLFCNFVGGNTRFDKITKKQIVVALRQIREARRLSQSEAQIEVIEAAVDKLRDLLLIERAERYGHLRDGRPFLTPGHGVGEECGNGYKGLQSNAEIFQASRQACELCTLQPSVTFCKPCPLVTMQGYCTRPFSEM